MGILGTTISAVSTVWGVGTTIYKEGQTMISNEIDEETEIRVRKKLGNAVSSTDKEYKINFDIERKKVKKEAKEMAGKGALMILGFGLLF
jgi:hypothetical protein